MTTSRYGDFDFQTVVDQYEPRLADLHPADARFGLHLQSQYFYGGLRDADGTTYMLERKICGPMTSGVWLMSDADGGEVALHPRALSSARGETLRTFTPDRREWSNHLMHAVGQRVRPSDDQPLSLVIDDEGIDWSEGELLAIKGSIQGPGFQFYAPARAEPLFYTTQVYWVTGHVLGNEVEGFIGLDHAYFLAGMEWKEYRYFNDLELSWEVFANRFVDGTVEYGVIVMGRQGWSGAATFDGGKLVASTDRLQSSYDLDEEGFIDEGRFDVDGTAYTFTGAERGKMRHFGEARWGGYFSQAGITRRVGDERELANGFCWIEFFPDRIRAGGLAKG